MACFLKQVLTCVNWFFLDLICFLKFLWSRTLCLLYKITCRSCVANIGGLALKSLAPWILEEYRPKANFWIIRDITQDWILLFASCNFERVVPYYLSFWSSHPNPVFPTQKLCSFYHILVPFIHLGKLVEVAGVSGGFTPDTPAEPDIPVYLHRSIRLGCFWESFLVRFSSFVNLYIFWENLLHFVILVIALHDCLTI